MPKIVRRLLLLALGLYLLPLIVLCGFQRLLVFNAPHSRKTTEEARLSGVGPPPGAMQVSLRTGAGDSVAAYYGHALSADGQPDRDFPHRPTLLFFYGKGSSLAGGRELFQSLRRQSINVLMPDYVGFGLSGGSESEANCFATATACYKYLRAQPDINQKTLVIAGFSLGSGVAVDLAAQESQAGESVAGLALFAAYTSMADEAHQEYPLYPVPLLRRLLKYPFNSESKMPQVKCPVLIVHSRADHLIPFSMSDRIAAVSGGPVTRVMLLNADHTEYFTRDGPTLYPALKQFLQGVSKQR